MISEGSCDTEDCRNDTENVLKLLKVIKTCKENSCCKL